MIRREQRQNVTVLSLEHGRANALDLELCVELEHALAAVREDGSEAVVLTGRGTVFSAGVDLRRLLAESDRYLDRFLPALERALRSLFVLPKPLVAAINGHAIAGGCLLAQAADLRLVADAPLRLGVPELRVGLPFPTVGLEVLRHQVGSRNAADLALSGRAVGPEEARGLGLCDRIMPAADLLDAAVAAAADLATIPAATFALTKRQLRRPVLEVIDRDVLAFDAEVRELWSAPDVRDALAAYVEAVLGRR
jgi:enoyl-CoA hydratase